MLSVWLLCSMALETGSFRIRILENKFPHEVFSPSRSVAHDLDRISVWRLMPPNLGNVLAGDAVPHLPLQPVPKPPPYQPVSHDWRTNVGVFVMPLPFFELGEVFWRMGAIVGEDALAEDGWERVYEDLFFCIVRDE